MLDVGLIAAAVGVREVDRCAEPPLDAAERRELPPVVGGEGQDPTKPTEWRQPAHQRAGDGEGALSLRQQLDDREVGAPLHGGQHGAALQHDEVELPIPNARPRVHLGRPAPDALPGLPPPLGGRYRGHAPGMAPPLRPLARPLVERSPRQSVPRHVAVDGHPPDPRRALRREPPNDLVGAPALLEQLGHLALDRLEARWPAAPLLALVRVLLRLRGAVPPPARVALQLAGDGGGAAAHRHRDLAAGQPGPVHALHHRPV